MAKVKHCEVSENSISILGGTSLSVDFEQTIVEEYVRWNTVPNVNNRLIASAIECLGLVFPC